MQDSQELTHLPIHPTLLHPRTGDPLRAVGIVNGRVVWPIMGGDGSEGDANDSNDGDDNPDDQDGNGNDDGDGNDSDDNDDQDDDSDDRDDREVKRARKDAAKYRRQAREAQDAQKESNKIIEGLRKLLTGDDSDGEGDPAELTGQVEKLAGTNQSLTQQLLVVRLAGPNGADADELLDSSRFMDSLSELDSEDDDYRDQVARAIKTAVKNNPRRYSADQGSGQGGAELDGENGREKQRGKRKSGGLEGAIGRHLNGGK